MFVTPIPSQASEPSGSMRQLTAAPSRDPRAAARPANRKPSASRLEAFAPALASLDSRSRALADLQGLAAGGRKAANPWAAAMPTDAANLDDPELDDPMAAAEADPAGLTLDGAQRAVAAGSEAIAALQAASVAARDAVAAMAGAVQAWSQVAAAMAPVAAAAAAGPSTAAGEIPADPASLGSDATAKYLGAGFMGPGSGPGPGPVLADELRDVAPVPGASHAAANTYSNPRELAFGQTAAAHLEPLAMVPDAADAGSPSLDLLS